MRHAPEAIMDRKRTREAGTFDVPSSTATCGICSAATTFPQSTADVATIPRALEREMKRNGWTYTHVWGWVHAACAKRRRAEVAAGHIQRSIFDQDGDA